MTGPDTRAPRNATVGPMMFDPAPPTPETVPGAEPMAIDPDEVVAVIPDAPDDRGEGDTATDGSGARHGGVSGPLDTARATPWTVRRPDWALRLFLIALVGVFVVGIGFDTVDLVQRAFAASRALGLVVAGLCGGAAAGLLGLLIGELRGLARLRRLESLRDQSDRALAALGGSDGAGDGFAVEARGNAAGFAASAVGLYAERPDMAPAIARLREALPDAHDDARTLRLVERELMAPLDARAYRLTVLAARDTALATALVPAAIVDMLIVMWRNLKLVRAVSALYGTRPGYWASLRMLRRMLGNLAVAGVGEGVHHAAVDALGGSLAGSVSASLGKGVINGLLTARVGIAAMHACRPIAFSPEYRPSLAKVRGELLGLSRDLF